MDNLRTALRLPAAPFVTLTGAGGKSSLLFALAREYPAALVTTTTHLGAWQLPWADRVFFVRTPEDVRALEDVPLPGVTLLLADSPGEDGRAPGLPAETLKTLLALGERRSLPLLVEADGARRRPLKAPAAHEPNLPLFPPSPSGRGAGGEGRLPPFPSSPSGRNAGGEGGLPHSPPSPSGRGVGGEGRLPHSPPSHLTLAGLSALGRPLDSRSVHRPEIFSRLSGLPLGAPLTVEAIAAVLAHPAGGLKGIPAGVRRVAVLTQALTDAQRAAGQRLAGQLLGAYHAVLLAETRPVPPATPSPVHLLAVWEPVAAVVLAAGAGERIGRPKALLDWRGRPFVRHVAETALQAGCAPVIVVVGAETTAVREAVGGLPVQVVENPHWQAGQGTSVAAGAAALPPETGAALFLLVDQPHVPLSLLRALRAEHARTLGPLIAPFVDGRRANPVLFDRRTFPDLRALRGEHGGRALFSRYRLRYLPWHDRSLLLDVDTPEDYRRLVEEEG